MLTAAPATDKAIFGARMEQPYEISASTADELEALVAGQLPRDPYYPTAQPVDTVFVRPLDPKAKEKLRIRSYPTSEGNPHFLEIKHKVKQPDGTKLTLKDRVAAPSDIVDRLLAGESGASILKPETLTGADQDVARRAVSIIDEAGAHPVVAQQYQRSAFEAADGSVRITIDRNLRAWGIGALEGAGEVQRAGAIMDVKVVGETPGWVNSMLDTYKGAMSVVKDGKGSTALEELMGRVLRVAV
jgi:hypothetical protein